MQADSKGPSILDFGPNAFNSHPNPSPFNANITIGGMN